MPNQKRLQPNDGTPQSLLVGALACSSTTGQPVKGQREGSQSADRCVPNSSNRQSEQFYNGMVRKPAIKSIRKVCPPKGKWRLVGGTGVRGAGMERKLQRVS